MSLIHASYIEKNWRAGIAGLVYGRLEFIAPDGSIDVVVGPQPGPSARLQIDEWDVLRRVMARGDIGLGEEYIAGSWRTDSIENLVSLFLLNLPVFERFADGSFFNRLAFVIHNAFVRRNSLAGSARNIKAHYDVGNDFYSLWLDRSMTYSSALYADGAATLEAAQQNKYDRLLSKFGSGPRSVLEVGCGWGGFAESAVAQGHDVTGLTISPAQFAFATNRLNGKADIRLQDYRKSNGLYDMIVSIEMVEAVGERYWSQYFAILAERLKRGGSALIQAITIHDDVFAGYRTRSDFIRHYVFPGGMLIPLSKIKEEGRKAGLAFKDAIHFGQDYARTLREWSQRMHARRAEILALGHDEKFIRNWEFYLGMCAGAFNVGRSNVVQVELVKT